MGHRNQAKLAPGGELYEASQRVLQKRAEIEAKAVAIVKREIAAQQADPGPKSMEAWELLKRLGDHERVRDPSLTKPQAIAKAMQTHDGRRLQEIYTEAVRQGDPAVQMAAEVEKAAVSVGGPYHDQLTKMAHELIAKSANGLTFAQAYDRVLQSPEGREIYARHKAAGGGVMATRERSLFRVAKVNYDRQQVFGVASISVAIDGQQAEDLQGDQIDVEVLERAVYPYVLKFGETGEMHEGGPKGRLIESMVFTPEKCAALGLEPDAVAPRWWVGFQIDDPSAWARFKSGQYEMFSIQGRGTRLAPSSVAA